MNNTDFDPKKFRKDAHGNLHKKEKRKNGDKNKKMS